MKISYDKEVDAISVTLRKGRVDRTVEISPEIMLDYDVDGNPLYLEILGASEKLGKKDLSHITVGSVQVPFAVPA
jgi:uncharacterized protein YuzE